MERFEHQGVEGLRVGRFPGRLNTTCILYRIGDTVVDTGPPNQWRTVRRFLEERRVTRLLVTHHHEDHSGNLAAARRATGAQAHCPERSRAPLAGGFRLRPYQLVVWGRPERIEPAPLPEAVAVRSVGASGPDGTSAGLVPIPAPGHSADMTCYLEPERGWLFSGDLYVSAKTRYLRSDEDLPRQLDTLRAVLALDFGTVFCSHRGILPDGRRALERKLDFLEGLCRQVADLRARGLGRRRITRRLLGREDLMSWVTGFHYSKRNLVDGCLAAIDAEG